MTQKLHHGIQMSREQSKEFQLLNNTFSKTLQAQSRVPKAQY